tara:strand:- start:216 stop:437 length:222 start_codon:yes stop_codon:yes gene_type:complete
MKSTKVNYNKSKFEEFLYNLNNQKPLGYRKHNEHDYVSGGNTIVHLYYNDDDKHIGSWSKGQGWFFAETINAQ